MRQRYADMGCMAGKEHYVKEATGKQQLFDFLLPLPGL